MKIVKTLFDKISLSPPLGLTVGNFDGVHLGHKHLLKRLREKVGKNGTVAVLTFSNHPMEVLKKSFARSPLCTLDEKLALLEKEGVDLVILLEFNEEIAQLSYLDFIEKIRKNYPFTYLVLGEGATFGKGRVGTHERIRELGAELGFEAEYLPKLFFEGQPVSSGRIRELIQEGSFEEASRLLGRNVVK